jgi:hypothetical protein
MTKRTRRTVELVLLAIVVLALLGRLPSYTYVRVSGPEGMTVIESSGTGPQSVQVIGPDGSFAKSDAW